MVDLVPRNQTTSKAASHGAEGQFTCKSLINCNWRRSISNRRATCSCVHARSTTDYCRDWPVNRGAVSLRMTRAPRMTSSLESNAENADGDSTDGDTGFEEDSRGSFREPEARASC